MESSAPILNFTTHNGRLATIARFAHFTTSAIREFESALPKRESYIAAREKIVDSFKGILGCFENPPELDVEKFSSQIDSAVIFSEPSKELVYNLSLVMLCTEVEIFLEHLIDVIFMK